MKALQALRRFFRNIAALFLLGFRAAPGRSVGLIFTEILAAGCGLSSTYMVKYVVEEATDGNSRGALIAAAILAVTSGATMITYVFYANFAHKVIDDISLHLDSELIRLTAQIPTLEYQDRPIYADKIDLIRSNRT